jgi:hypothetical protein
MFTVKKIMQIYAELWRFLPYLHDLYDNIRKCLHVMIKLAFNAMSIEVLEQNNLIS